MATGNIREERLQIMLSPEELSAIDNFRYGRRMPSRAAAVRELLQLGLAVHSKIDGEGRKSSEFGLFSRGPKGHTDGSNGSGATE